MRHRLPILWFAAAAAAVSVACGDGPHFADVRDIRPTTVEKGERLVIETLADSQTALPLLPGAPTQVVLRGVLRSPGHDDRELGPAGLVLPNARAVEPNRVVVNIDDYVAVAVGGPAVFEGTVEIQQKRSPEAPFEAVTDRPSPDGDERSPRVYNLKLFPRTVRSFAYGLVGGREDDAFLSWLGAAVEPVKSPTGEGTGLKITAVRGGFSGLPFLFEYDCGRWVEERAGCYGGPDALIHFNEARQQGFTDVATFDRVDDDANDIIDRHEAQHGEAEPSPAAKAGLKVGDIIVKADGQPTPAAGALLDAWQGTGATVDVTVVRDGAETTVTLPRYGKPSSIPEGFLLAFILVAVGLLVIGPIPVIGGLIVVWERKISGYMQSRPGPNRVGPGGWLQWLADGVKLIVKEDIIPTESDAILFRLSPFLVFTGVFATFVVFPWSPLVQVADLNIGILYGLSVTSVVVVGIIMGGWASNSKWSLLGGMRSAAQIISYELPASIAVLAVVTMAGTLSTQELVRNQGGAPWHWHMFDNPFAFACFFIFFISALAEGNRTPFDLPEAESELVAGYNTEYSGFRFSIFALAEWVNLVVIGAVLTTVFLGGWNIPGVPADTVESSTWLQLLAFIVFAGKVVSIVFVCIWIRWTLPRFRVDHMMNMCWKYFIPISLASVIGVSLWTWGLPDLAREIARWVMFLVGGVGIGGFFIKRVLYTRRTTSVWELRGA